MSISIASIASWRQLGVNELATRWPATQPFAMIHSGGAAGPWARWSVLTPPRGHLRIAADQAIWSGPRWPQLEQALASRPPDDPLGLIDAAISAGREEDAEVGLPFTGGWLVALGYELGGIVEPHTCAVDGPLADLLWCPDCYLHDGQSNTWWQVGAPDITLESEAAIASLELSPWTSRPEQVGFEDAVRRTIEYIRQGDLFQANIARQLIATCRGNLRGFGCDALARSGAWFGSWLEFPDKNFSRAQLGLSPELFLDLEAASGRLRSRPIKGTAAAGTPVAALAKSEKDAAELNMIVDLMRNDLGRVCEIGTVGVTQTRTIESHPTVHHGVAEVTGRLSPGVSMADLLRACFPPGSVTGAPKVRAMQVIDELEPFRRGPYCGAVGYASRNGDLRLGVSIRTLAFEGRASNGFTGVQGSLAYGTGCGIVADSVPELEFEESQHKAAVLRRLTPPAPSVAVLNSLT